MRKSIKPFLFFLALFLILAADKCFHFSRLLNTESLSILQGMVNDHLITAAVLYILITRIVPLFPYNLQNFAYGITDIPLIPYTLYTFLFMMPGVALFTVGTVGLTAEEVQAGYIMLSIVLLGVVLLLGRRVKKRYFNRKEN